MLKNWINIFIYHLKNNKLFSALNVFGLAIGIAGLIFALLYWNDEQSYDAWNPEKEKVYQVLVEMPDGTVSANQPSLLKFFLEKDPEIENVLYSKGDYINDRILYKGKSVEIDKIINIQSTFFSFFPFKIIKGDAITALKDETSIAISEDIAKRVFGDENPIGKQVKVFYGMFVVRAVYRIPGNSSIAPEMLIDRIGRNFDSNKNQSNIFNFKVLLKLKTPSKAEEIKKKIEQIYYNEFTLRDAKEQGITPEEVIKKNGRIKVVLEPLSKARLHSIVDGYPEGRGNYQFLLIMAGLSILILILSIVNYVNMATANAIKRAKEVGVRKIVGASRGNIISQFVFETILISSFSILLALVIVELALPYYNEFLEKNLMMQGSEFYLQLILIFIITILVAGIFPAVYVSNFETLKVLKGNFGRSKSGVWLRNGMLVLQFSIASFFIIGSYIVYHQVKYLSNKDLGFKGEQVMSITFTPPVSDYYQEAPILQNIFNRYNTIKQELSKIKGVEQVSTGIVKFGDGAMLSNVTYKDVNFQGQNMAVDFGMLEMMKIKVIKGRGLDQKLVSDTINSVMINETALKMMKEKNPIGKEIELLGKKLKIVGIVKDFNLFSPEDKVPPMTIFHVTSFNMSYSAIRRVYVKLKADNMENTIADIEKFWTTKVNTEYPFEYDFVDEEYARTYETYVKQKNLFSLLNVVVIGIALFGLFALASYSIQRRMKEIAIRKTLGAETNVLLKELSKQYILYCIIGFLIALFPVYYLLNKWLENFAFRIDITVFPFVFGFIILLVLTLIIVLSRAYQATKTDILKYLKYE
ncbi:ABC transporter permease [Flavobacterium sp. ZT3R17]|uniref:ABC transporter permease n=1 Tax=Flavobacterium cryoconiti TaxID=3398736 RepID=UPI003A876348